uniref:GCM domain-containing protein n=1 Tax=Macrostomum lignano TaxID=282301 RepID=A0A1I8HR09_9PLAT
MTLGQQQQSGQSQSLSVGATSASSANSWEVTDAHLPVPPAMDAYQYWPNGPCRFIYSDASEEVRRHTIVAGRCGTRIITMSGCLKKSCLGVLLCSAGCGLPIGEGGDIKQICLRPAICDKARRKQCGSRCPNPKCTDGVLYLRQCRGQGGFPVTHFWRHANNGMVYFQAKGCHDHPTPDFRPQNEIFSSRQKANAKRRPSDDAPSNSSSSGLSSSKALKISATVGDTKPNG